MNSIDNTTAAQRTRLLAHLRRAPLTTLEARERLNILHPGGRIKELRDAGNDIATHWQWEADATGKEHKQALYVLLSCKGGAA